MVKHPLHLIREKHLRVILLLSRRDLATRQDLLRLHGCIWSIEVAGPIKLDPFLEEVPWFTQSMGSVATQSSQHVRREEDEISALFREMLRLITI